MSTRRTSVYTIRLRSNAKLQSVTDALKAAGQPACDVGEASVSFRTTDDTAALRVAAAATEPSSAAHELTTGLGVHRRTVTP